MSKVLTTKPPKVLMPTIAEDKAITAAARADPDAQPLTPKAVAGHGAAQGLAG